MQKIHTLLTISNQRSSIIKVYIVQASSNSDSVQDREKGSECLFDHNITLHQ